MTAAPGQAQRVAEYRRAGHWTDVTYADLVARHAAERPTGVMLMDPDRAVTWADAARWIDAVACALARRGLARDDVLATWLPNSIENYLLRIACEKAGVRWLPIGRSARPHELRALLVPARPAALVFATSDRRDIWSELGEVLPALGDLRLLAVAGVIGSRRFGALRLGDSAARGVASSTVALEQLAGTSATEGERAALRERSYRADEMAMLLPTSGSTGAPKLAMYLLGGATCRGRAQTELFGITANDRIAATVQGFGPSITPLLAAPFAGASVLVLDHVSPETLVRLIGERRITLVCAVPPILRELLPLVTAGADMSSVRIWYSTGMGLSVELAAALEAASNGVVMSGYGGVDLGCWTAPSPDDPPAVRHRTVGRPRGGTEVRLLDDRGSDASEGELAARGPSATMGYFGDPAATRDAWDEQGWFRTGDLARRDAAGDLKIVGRRSDVINRGGQKIHPADIEQLLETHPLVARAAVVPLPDERLGQRVCACIVPRDGARPTLDDVIAFLRRHQVASYKLPERLELRSELPLSTGGKVARGALARELAAAGNESDRTAPPTSEPPSPRPRATP